MQIGIAGIGKMGAAIAQRLMEVGHKVTVWNRSADVEAGVLVDGHRVSTLGKADRAVIRIGPQRSLLATLPEATFVRRYRQSFAS